MFNDLIIKCVLMVMGFWLPSVLVNVIRAEGKEKAQAYGEKLCVGTGLFVVLLMFLI